MRGLGVPFGCRVPLSVRFVCRLACLLRVPLSVPFVRDGGGGGGGSGGAQIFKEFCDTRNHTQVAHALLYVHGIYIP